MNVRGTEISADYEDMKVDSGIDEVKILAVGEAPSTKLRLLQKKLLEMKYI